MIFVDPNIARKNKIQNAHLQLVGSFPDGSPVFSELEFNITGLCNRLCTFCPRIDPKTFPNLKEHITLDLFQKIIDDLATVDYSGRLAFCGLSEPLLHKKLLGLVEIARQGLPNSWLEIVTNGDRLTIEKLKALFDAGLTTLVISMYDGPEQIRHFESLVEKSNISREQVMLRKRYYRPKEGYGIHLTSRAGTVKINEVNTEMLPAGLDHQCFYVHYRMMVDYNGDVLLCPHDWGKRLIAGNLKDENIIDIWNEEILNSVRKRLGKADRNFAPCKFCDVLGTRQGREHFNAWQDYFDTLDE